MTVQIALNPQIGIVNLFFIQWTLLFYHFFESLSSESLFITSFYQTFSILHNYIIILSRVFEHFFGSFLAVFWKIFEFAQFFQFYLRFIALQFVYFAKTCIPSVERSYYGKKITPRGEFLEKGDIEVIGKK